MSTESLSIGTGKNCTDTARSGTASESCSPDIGQLRLSDTKLIFLSTALQQVKLRNCLLLLNSGDPVDVSARHKEAAGLESSVQLYMAWLPKDPCDPLPARGGRVKLPPDPLPPMLPLFWSTCPPPTPADHAHGQLLCSSHISLPMHGTVDSVVIGNGVLLYQGSHAMPLLKGMHSHLQSEGCHGRQ